MNKFIAVPSNALAEEDKLQETQYTEEEVENKRKKLDELQQRAKRVCNLIHVYRSKTKSYTHCYLYVMLGTFKHYVMLLFFSRLLY